MWNIPDQDRTCLLNWSSQSFSEDYNPCSRDITLTNRITMFSSCIMMSQMSCTFFLFKVGNYYDVYVVTERLCFRNIRKNFKFLKTFKFLMLSYQSFPFTLKITTTKTKITNNKQEKRKRKHVIQI